MTFSRKQGWRSSESSRLPLMWPGACFSNSRNSLSPSRVLEFPLYPRNAEVLSHQLRNPLGFSYMKNM